MKRLVRIVVWLGIFVFLCGILPRLIPAVLPPISVEAEPVACLGGDLAHHCAGGFPITNTIVATLIVDALLILLFWIAARRPKLVPSGLQNFLESMIELLYSQAEQVAGKNAPKVFPIGATIFLFVFFANYMELLPGVDSIGYVHHAEGTVQGYELDRSTPPGSPVVFLNVRCPVITPAEYDGLSPAAKQARTEAGCQEPIPAAAEGAGEAEAAEAAGWAVVPTVRTASTDINVTLALALVAVSASQVYGVINHMPHGKRGVGAVLTGLKRYLSKFFNISGFRREGAGKIFGAVDFFASLLEGLGEFVRILSFTFRLFGNIFAGTILIFVVMSLIPYVGPVAALLLETFVGLIQAYVFMMLTFVFMNVAAQVHGEHAEAGH
ncbi:MAG TPA: FoF1 ATP synthase subunit a [Anaerolineae bacterium]|nr:FoF1 ATP synthase subunit a [Anaerolineae bacterium]